MCVHARVCVRVCVRDCVCVSVCACVSVCVREREIGGAFYLKGVFLERETRRHHFLLKKESAKNKSDYKTKRCSYLGLGQAFP